MSISEKIKAINNKIELNKDQYNLNRPTAKISASSSGMLVSMNLWLVKMFYQEKTC